MRPFASRNLLLLLAALLLAPFAVYQGRRLYRESPLATRSLQNALAACAQRPTSAEAHACYREGVQKAVRAKGPEWTAGACARVGDPLCFQAFAEEAPSDSWCAYAREHGWFAYKLCLLAASRK